MHGRIPEEEKMGYGFQTRRLAQERGFTVIEMVMTMLVLSVVGIGVGLFMNPLMDLTVQKRFMNDYVAESRLAIFRMQRDISQIKDAASVTAATDSQLSFTDTNNDAISYILSAGNLLRNSVVLAAGVTSFQITYWDSANTQLAAPTLIPETNIARIQILLSVASGGNATTQRILVRPRNLWT
jgi:prepilin-type N-terminal cleavage/methylation domain-containing protein